MEKFFLYLAAFTPGIGIAIYIYFMDKDEREPIRLVLFSFILGIISLGLKYLIYIPLENVGHISEHHAEAGGAYSFGLNAFIEEFCKFILIIGILYRNKNFNEPLDGIVYSIMVGMGFATIKNVIQAYTGVDSSVMSMFTNILAQASFAVLMGYLLGKAKFLHRNEVGYMIAALIVATLFQILYDYLQFLSAVSGIWIGSIIALVIIIYLGKQAFEIHQKASPFKK